MKNFSIFIRINPFNFQELLILNIFHLFLYFKMSFILSYFININYEV